MKQGQNSWEDTTRSDGVIVTKDAFQAHENKVYSSSFHDPVQRRMILERNARIRREQPLKPSVMKGHKLIMSVPLGDIPALEIEFPGLRSNVMSDQKKAMMAIAAKYPCYVQHQRK